uniref:DUF295 domain-containing protein n=1 Tax=Panagrolaimus sp. JU765 TaxID=591449 RepID=A0AC34QVT4_9BILA
MLIWLESQRKRMENLRCTITLTTNLHIPGRSVLHVIHGHYLDKLTFVEAWTTFRYAVLDPEHYGKVMSIEEMEDRVLLVAVNESTVVGPGEIKLRLVKGEIDQLSDSNVTSLSELVENQSKLLDFNASTDLVTLHPDFGHFTFVFNVAAITLASNPFVGKTFPVISKSLIVRPDDELIAVKFIDGKLQAERIGVIKFRHCIEEFDPEKRFLIDSDEQFCIEAIFPGPQNSPPNTLLFAIRDRIYLVGTVTKMTEFVGLASFVPKSCDELFDAGENKLCT